MARIRSVHPEICDSDELAQISAEAERTYVRLWTHLDDEGRITDRPKVLAARLYPVHDHVGPTEVDRDLAELATAGLIVRYRVDGAAYLAVRGSWDRWQQPRDPKPSAIPPPPGAQIDPVAQMTGETVRARRTAAGLSLRALAEQLDIDHAHLSRAERGQATLSVDLRQRLVQLLPAGGDHGDSLTVTTSPDPEPAHPVDNRGDQVVTDGDSVRSPEVTTLDDAAHPATDPTSDPDETAGDQWCAVVTNGDTEGEREREREEEWEKEMGTPLPPPSGGEPVTTNPKANPRAAGTSPRQTGTNPRAAGKRQVARDKAASYGRVLATSLDRRDALERIDHEYPDDPDLAAAAIDAYDHQTPEAARG